MSVKATCVVLLVIVGGIVMQVARGVSHDVKTQLFGGEQNFAAFMSANDVIMERLHAIPVDSQIPYARDPWDLSCYRRKSPVRLSSDQVRAVKSLINQPSAYEWGSTKACIPNYGILLKSRSNPEIKIALCFECDMLAVYAGNKMKHGVNTVDSFDKISDRLLAIAKAVYPKDSDLAHVRDPQR
jgi:hypothetical protein